ncbi:MAG: DEAD/DEAH box helicase [Pelosinus sp.]|nr:DEAD/DEAH box helicase [Pelosinus sp.]
MSGSFTSLGLQEALIEGLKKTAITVPTQIQIEVIPAALQGKDVIGQSATGTGKTLAYLLPIMQRIDTGKRETQCFILAPTHELAIQIEREIIELAKNSGLPITATPIIGNVNIARQIDKLKEKPHIIVGSSGRILELIKKKKIVAQTVKTIVLDEADRLFDESNLHSVQEVIKTTLRDRQLMLFSATFPPAIIEKAKAIMKEPAVLKAAGEAEVPKDIAHLYFVVEHRDKIEMLRKLSYHMGIKRALVFINKSENILEMTEKLNYHGLKAAGLHGGAMKNERKKALDDFRSGKISLLVASDIAARGLDIQGVTHVLNLDFPEDHEIYQHRVGRTGRLGQSGTAISLVTKVEALRLKKFERVLKIAVSEKKLIKGNVVDAHQQATAK